MTEFVPTIIYSTDALLFLCLTIQTISSIRERSKSDYQKKLSNYKLSIFGLAYLCLGIKFTSQTVVTFDYDQWDQDVEIFVAFLSVTLPTFLIITIASIISRFWYEIVSYMSFIEYDIDQIEKFNIRFKSRLVKYNILLFVYYIIFSAITFISDSENMLASLFLVMTIAYLIANSMMIYYGIKVYNQVFKTHDMGSRSLRTFLFTLIMTTFCFLIKIGADISLIVDAFAIDYHIGFIFLDTCAEVSAGGFWTLVAYLVGQFGSFFCLIMLLNKHAENSKRSFATRSLSNISDGYYEEKDEEDLPKTSDASFFVDDIEADKSGSGQK
eukprot:CAMPEP_0114592022 /NCGR_PEP_ID=MMETSP0125-20121206/13954_1 /TAXON_ID=485358 ORGANISM="Aristerostoma sp., Strain ATCC 50986" /NCGR_SAMPLE_ID=MMETSP0125 /ASSEMBLY_ACC=CAM_ASM_000245 /LENGTH=325 /DNA_ID=CAMNT_0001790461 /DNA_START=42 /DNA_END=1019 /DNA_ORIENTATION=-